jgi:hypothetical protein
MVFNATFNNIPVLSWQSVLLVEETGVPVENHLIAGGRHMVVIVWSLDLQLSMQSVPIATNVVSSNLLGRGVLDTKLCYEVCQ